MNDKVIIHWRNPETGATGHSTPISREDAEVWLEIWRKVYTGLIYWIEKA